MLKTIQWFEDKGLAKQKEQFHSREFAEDFQKFVTEEGILKLCSFLKVMDQIRINITAPTVCMSSPKSVDFTGEPTGIAIMYPHWDWTRFSWVIMKKPNI